MVRLRVPFGRLAACLLALLVATIPLATRAADPYEIWVIGELTGSNAFVGNQEVKGTLAIESLINKQGGINGRPIKIIVKDDQTNPQVAVQFMNEAIAAKVPFVIGGGVVSTCQAMAALVKDNGPIMYCWSSGIAPPAGSMVYSSAFAALDQMFIGVRYLREKGSTKFAAITSNDGTGQDADRNLDKVFNDPENKTISLISHEHFNGNDISVSAQIARIKQSGATALIAWTSGTPFGTILRGMRDGGLDIPILTTGGNLSYAQMEAYKDTMPSNLVFSAIPVLVPEAVTDPITKKAALDFINAFKPQGIRPDIGYAVSWDGLMLLLNGVKKYGFDVTATQMRDYLDSVTTYRGVMGPMDFKASPQRGLPRENIIVARWDPAKDRWIALSKPGGLPLAK